MMIIIARILNFINFYYFYSFGMKYSLVILIFFTQTIYSQIGKNTNSLFEKEGTNYDFKDVDPEFTSYSYSQIVDLGNGKTCDILITYFIDPNKDLCFMETYVTCSAAANTYVKLFDNNYIKIGSNMWKNYADNTIYTLQIDGDFLIVEYFYD